MATVVLANPVCRFPGLGLTGLPPAGYALRVSV